MDMHMAYMSFRITSPFAHVILSEIVGPRQRRYVLLPVLLIMVTIQDQFKQVIEYRIRQEPCSDCFTVLDEDIIEAAQWVVAMPNKPRATSTHSPKYVADTIMRPGCVNHC